MGFCFSSGLLGSFPLNTFPFTLFYLCFGCENKSRKTCLAFKHIASFGDCKLTGVVLNTTEIKWVWLKLETLECYKYKNSADAICWSWGSSSRWVKVDINCTTSFSFGSFVFNIVFKMPLYSMTIDFRHMFHDCLGYPKVFEITLILCLIIWIH